MITTEFKDEIASVCRRHGVSPTPRLIGEIVDQFLDSGFTPPPPNIPPPPERPLSAKDFRGLPDGKWEKRK